MSYFGENGTCGVTKETRLNLHALEQMCFEICYKKEIHRFDFTQRIWSCDQKPDVLIFIYL